MASTAKYPTRKRRSPVLNEEKKLNSEQNHTSEQPETKSPHRSEDTDEENSCAGNQRELLDVKLLEPRPKVKLKEFDSSKQIVQLLEGRESEMATIESHLQKCISSSYSMSVYISGPPGTGKTASVNAVLHALSVKHRLIVINVNCVSTNTEAALLRLMSDKLPNLRSSRRNIVSSKLLDTVESCLQRADCPVVLVLDEIDYIQPKNRNILYTAFQWPSKFSSMALIAISNSLDLTERELPKLKLAIPPIVLPFSPYSKEDLLRILKTKLSSNSDIDERAVELCSRKVASMTGDVRHAMQIAQQMLPSLRCPIRCDFFSNFQLLRWHNIPFAINCVKFLWWWFYVMSQEVVSDFQYNFTVQAEMKNSLNESSKLTSAPSMSCPRVLGAITNVYRSSLDRARIPLQQKILLATMLRLADKQKNTTLDKDTLLEAYEKVCNTISLPYIDTECANSAFALLESLSVLKCTRSQKCQLLVDIPTAVDYIADSALMAQINNLALN
ncbi:unnamed protein product [Anisakis simplex]|uniref:AAA domain-containing protein n=1 Tax=Anisakis simplex TaxID=6269 RepID=A0A158PN58_ANISI|nr:unnamed protein product [Anisakis simplex]